MSRGDFVAVYYKKGNDAASHVVMAENVGGSVVVDEPRPADAYLVVKELNKAGEAVKTARFAKAEVIAVTEGHDTSKWKAKKK